MVKSKKVSFKKSWIAMGAGAVVAVGIVVGVIAVLKNSSHCRGIVGAWKLQSEVVQGDYVLTFTGGKTGVDNQNGTMYDFNYQDYEGVVELKYAEDEVSTSYSYSLSKDNNTLTLQDALGDDVVYICR